MIVRHSLASLGLVGLLWFGGAELATAQSPKMGQPRLGQPGSVQAQPCPECSEAELCRSGRCGHAWCACMRQRAPWDMQAYGRQASSSLFDAINAQSMNGRALELTVWNHHFDPQSGDLLPSGIALLNRLARRQAQQPDFFAFVETAHDIEYTQDQVESYARRIDQLDATRVAAVREYVTKVLRRPNSQILIHNPAPVGMPAEEAMSAYVKNITLGPQGVLPRNMVLGTEVPGR